MGVEEQIPWEDILAPPGTYTVFTVGVYLGKSNNSLQNIQFSPKRPPTQLQLAGNY